MKTILKQSIEESFKQGIQAFQATYPEISFAQHSLRCCSPTEDATSFLANWVDCEYDNELLNSSDYQDTTKKEWADICIDEMYHMFDYNDDDYEETGDTLAWLRSEVYGYLGIEE
ncbi:MAG: hypothetical protein ACK5M0_04500 [Bacteroidales bacterium]